MSNVAVFEAINMNREQLLEESGRMLPILKEINDKEDSALQQEYYQQYTAEQQNQIGNLASNWLIEKGIPFLVAGYAGLYLGPIISARLHLGIMSVVLSLAMIFVLYKVIRKVTGGVTESFLNRRTDENKVYDVASMEIARLRTEVDTLRQDHMDWMTRVFPEEMLFYDAISYIHQALRMGMVDNFKEAVNNYMQHLHQKKMEFHTERAANNAERAAIAAEQTAYEVRQLRFEEAMRFFFSG